MLWRIVVLALVVLAIFSGIKHQSNIQHTQTAVTTAQPTPLPSPTPQTPQFSRSVVEGKSIYKYLCFLPEGYGKEPKFWPCIIFLHGQCSNDDLEKLKGFGPVKYALNHDDFPFIAVAPATANGWNVTMVNLFLTEMSGLYRIDQDRIYLTGHSMGAHATWKIAAAYPHRFAAIAPVSGAGNPRQAIRKHLHLPTWVFHGARDTVVPVERGLQMAGALKGAGGNVKSTIYIEQGHDIWDEAYNDQQLYDWLLQHKRPSPKIKKENLQSNTGAKGSVLTGPGAQLTDSGS